MRTSTLIATALASLLAPATLRAQAWVPPHGEGSVACRAGPPACRAAARRLPWTRPGARLTRDVRAGPLLVRLLPAAARRVP